MKKIVLFAARNKIYGGIDQYIQTIIQALSELPEDEFEIFFLTLGFDIETKIFKKNLKYVKIQKISFGRIIRYFILKTGITIKFWRILSRFIDPVFKEIKKINPCAVIFPAHDSYAAELDVPSLSAVHDLMHRYETRFPEVSANGEFERREKRFSELCAYSKGVLVDSETGKRHVIESYNVNPENVYVLPYIAPKYITGYLNNPNNKGFSEKYLLPEKYIFYPAQFWLHKNHCSLLKAASDLLNKLPDLKLVFSGSKKNGYDNAVKTVKEFNLEKNVIFLGYVPDSDLPYLYKKARALVMPTYFGPTNIPPLEAFAAGCPVAISKIYGIPEQVKDCALLFNPGSIDEISDAIFKLWTDDKLCEELIRKGFGHFQNWNSLSFKEKLRKILIEFCAKQCF